MRVAYVARAPIPSRTAASVHVMRMCAAYARQGHAVDLVVPRFRAWTEPGVHDDFAFYGLPPAFAIRKLAVPLRGRLSSAGVAFLLPLAVRRCRPDLVHSRSVTAAWGITRISRLPIVLEMHSPPPENARLARYFRAVVRSGRVVAIVAITEALAERLRPALAREVPVVVEPDAVESSWVEDDLDREAARRRIGLAADGRPVAVYSGQLYPGRGIGHVLAIARRLPDHLFVFVGGLEENLAARRQEARGLDNVRFAGFRPPGDVFAYLRAADVLLMPYGTSITVAGGTGDTSAFASPLKMFEYMAAGRPIVSSDLPVLREVLEDGRNCLLVPPRDVEAWVDAVRRLAGDPGLAGRLGDQARRQVARHTWDERARRLAQWAPST